MVVSIDAVGEGKDLREGADSIVCLDTAIFVVDSYPIVRVGDVRDNGVEHQSRIIRLQERICFADDKGVETPRVKHVVVLLRVLIEGRILSQPSAFR